MKLNQNVKKSLGLFLALGIAGCATLSDHKLGEPIGRGQNKVRVKLEGKGQIFVAQRYLPKAKCALLKRALNVSVQGEAGTPPVVMIPNCEMLKGQYAILSKEVLQPGTYTVQITKGEGAKLLLEKPLVSARLEDPDFNSGADFIAQGAKELPVGQVAKGFVSYANGNQTDWIKVPGKGGAVSLTLVDGSEKKNITAQVYDLSRGARAPRLMGSLGHKKTRSFPLKSDNLYVKLKSETYSGEGNYSLIRGDSAPSVAAVVSGGKKLSVIDCYQVAEGESVVLLEANESLKVQDEVIVFGKSSSGEIQQLGECEVTNVQAGQASCRMSGRVDSRFTDFRATKKQGTT